MIRRSPGPCRLVAGAGLLGLALIACADTPVLAPEQASARLLLEADVSRTRISGLAVEITAPDLAIPLVFNLAIAEGVASGMLTVPVGSDRTLTVRGFDARGLETHRGSRTVDIRAGLNPPVALTLLPLSGELPVEVVLGSYRVSVRPERATVAAGDRIQLTASITDSNQGPVEGRVHWATLEPEIATVDSQGLVSTWAAGEARIVAVYGGVAGSTQIAVVEP